MSLRPRHIPSRTARSFTLTELLVVMAVIGIVAAMTLVGYRSVAKNARLSSAENTVMAALDQARGLAMKTNNYVLVAFRTTIDERNRQRTEVLTAQWTGESSGPCVTFASTALRRPVDRFVLAPGVPVRYLAEGIGIAAPTYGYAPANAGEIEPGDDLERAWFTLSNFRNISEAPGNMIGVLYSAEGTVVSRNAQADSYRQYIDFNRSYTQELVGAEYNWDGMVQTPCTGGPQVTAQEYDETLFWHELDVADLSFQAEPFVRVAPFLAVYDDDGAREQFDASAWNDPLVRLEDLGDFVRNNGRRISFNRYSGVVTR